MEKINLMKFGMEVLGYKNEGNCVRYFISKVNAFLNLSENNNTATVKELIKYSVASNNKTFKDWAKKEMDLLLSEDLTTLVRETFVLPPKKETVAHKKEVKKEKAINELKEMNKENKDDNKVDVKAQDILFGNN